FIGDRIQKFDSSGNYLSQFGAAGSGNSQFNGPQYIHFDSSGNLWVIDFNNNRLQEFDSSGNFIKTIYSIPGYANSHLSGPDDFAFDSCGNIWIQDETDNNMIELDYMGNYVTTFQIAGETELQTIAIDASNHLYSGSTNENLFKVVTTANSAVMSFGSSGSGN